jgi:hypothetical protein
MKILGLLMLTLAILGLTCVNVQASIIDDLLKYVSERPVKAGLSYDIDDNNFVGSIGTVLVENAFKVDRLDIDLIASGEELDILNNNNQILSIGASYNLDLTASSKLSLGASVGVERFENFENEDNLGEAKALLTIAVKKQF